MPADRRDGGFRTAAPSARGRWRAAGVRRREFGQQHFEGHVDPDRQAVGVDGRAILGIDERAAAGRNDGMPLRQQRPDDLPLDGAKVRLPFAREDFGDRAPLARFDEHIHVFGAPAEPPRQGLRQRRLTGSHEPDEINLVRLQEGVVTRRATREWQRTRDRRWRPSRPR